MQCVWQSERSSFRNYGSLPACALQADRRDAKIELAELAGVGTRFVSELERGKRTAQLGLALELERMVGVDILA